VKQQTYLTANEVLELLRKGVLPNLSQQQQQLFMQLANRRKLLSARFNDPDKEIPILEHCANFLRGKGIHVYLRIDVDCDGNPDLFYFVAGECGRVYERLFELIDRLEFLSLFLADYKSTLPPQWFAEKKEIDTHTFVMTLELMPFLEKAYLGDNRNKVKFWCSMCSDYADKVEAYLKSLGDLEKAAMLATLL